MSASTRWFTCFCWLVRTPPRTVAVTTIFEERLEQRFDHPLGRQLHNLVLEAAHPKRSTLLTAWLRDIHPELGLRSVGHPFEAGGHIVEIRLQIFSIHRLGH